MVQCNEIRLGNYVLINDQLRKVSLVSTTDGVLLIGCEDEEGNAMTCNAKDVQPLPMSDDVLRKCGFVFLNYFHFWQLISTVDGKRIEMDIDPDYNLIDYMRRPVVKAIRSLHQLQNLFFALHGFEIGFCPGPDVKGTAFENEEEDLVLPGIPLARPVDAL